MNVLLHEAEPAILAALKRLCEKDEAIHPFVIVEKVGRPDVFLQYATKDGVLYFDSPPLKIYVDSCVMEGLSQVEVGASRAISTFLLVYGLQADDRVLITEEDDSNSKGKGESEVLPSLRRLFGFA